MIDTTVFQDKKAVYYTLGCKLNFAETSSLGKKLKESLKNEKNEFFIKMEFNDDTKLEGYLSEVSIKEILSEFDSILPPLEKLF